MSDATVPLHGSSASIDTIYTVNVTRTSPTIHHLPPEVLVEIFRWSGYRRMYHDKQRNSKGNGSGWTYAVSSPMWFPFMRVCRQWRELAYGTPSLWRTIEMKGDLCTAGYALARSRNTAVDFVFTDNNSIPHSIPLVLSVAHRIRRVVALNLNLDGEAALKMLLKINMPALQELVVFQASDWHASKHPCLPPNLFPSLRAVRLMEAYIPWQSPIIAQLGTIRINNVCMGAEDTLDDFLSRLGSHGTDELQLEHLELSHVHLWPRNDQHTQATASQRTITLPKLRSLKIESSSARDIYILLSHVKLGPRVRIQIAVKSLCHRYRDRGEPLGLLDVVPQDPLQIPLLKTVVLVGVDDFFQFVCAGAGPATKRPELIATLHPNYPIMRVDTRRRRKYSLDDALDAICTLFAGSSHMKLFFVRQMRTEQPPVSLRALSRVFCTFAGLVVLEYSTVWRDIGTLLAALAGDPEEGLVLPRLRKLLFHKLPWYQSLLSSLAQCLELRASLGTTLNELYIQLQDRPKDSFHLRLHAHELQKLGKVVSSKVECRYS